MDEAEYQRERQRRDVADKLRRLAVRAMITVARAMQKNPGLAIDSPPDAEVSETVRSESFTADEAVGLGFKLTLSVFPVARRK